MRGVSYLNALLEGLAMAMRLSDGFGTTSGDTRPLQHGRPMAAVRLLDAHHPESDSEPAGLNDDPAPSTDMPGGINNAMALSSIEAQEDRVVKSFLLTYMCFVLFLAILFVFVCVPP